MDLTGKLIKKTEVKEYGANGFRKREIVIKTEDQYPQMVEIQLHQDNCGLAGDLKKDDLIKVSINIQGREWINPEGEAKYFNSIVGWRIEKIENQAAAPAETHNNDANEPDDLPFS